MLIYAWSDYDIFTDFDLCTVYLYGYKVCKMVIKIFPTNMQKKRLKIKIKGTIAKSIFFFKSWIENT